MKILEEKYLKEMPDISIIKFARFKDNRGYFTESFSKRDFGKLDDTLLNNLSIQQSNESFSFKNTIRGLHFQWNPYMSKLVRTIQGHMIDLILDIRVGSNTFGCIVGYDMPSNPSNDYSEWICVPKGFAHGNLFLEDTTIEYFCSGEYSQGCESGISPFCKEINWSLCDGYIKEKFDGLKNSLCYLMSDKDLNGNSLSEWKLNPNSDKFKFTHYLSI